MPVLDYRRQAVGTLRVGLSGAYVIRHLTAGVSAVEQNCTNVRIVQLGSICEQVKRLSAFKIESSRYVTVQNSLFY